MQTNQEHSSNNRDSSTLSLQRKSKATQKSRLSQLFRWALEDNTVLIQLIFLKLLASIWLFLWLFDQDIVAYVAAFVSIFIQIPVLFGENGLTPVSVSICPYCLLFTSPNIALYIRDSKILRREYEIHQSSHYFLGLRIY